MLITLKHLELTSSLGMDHSFWNPFPVEMCHLVHVHQVLHHHWSPWANRDDILLVINRNSLFSSQYVS